VVIKKKAMGCRIFTIDILGPRVGILLIVEIGINEIGNI